MRVLLLEDEAVWAEHFQTAIARVGGDATWMSDGASFVEAASRHGDYDVLLVDRLLDGQSDGLAWLKTLRGRGVTTPAIIISQLGSTDRKVEGLDGGADDYLPKPFDESELAARLRSLVRRADDHGEIRRLGPLSLGRVQRSVRWKGQLVEVTRRGFDILWLLVENGEHVTSRQQLWRRVWSELQYAPDDGVIDVALSRLRAELQAVGARALLRTCRGRGYVLAV